MRSIERTIVIGEIPMTVTRKRIRHLHLRVHPPDGRVTISAPFAVRWHVVDAFVASRLDWIRRQRDRLRRQPNEEPIRFVTGESHFLWGVPRQLFVVERDGRPRVTFDDRQITLFARPGSDAARRAGILHHWHTSILRETLPPLIRTWEQRLAVRVEGCHLRRMKTRWGTCNPRTQHIRLNTELVTKPGHLLEYVLVHEMVHLIVPNHGARFVARMDEHYPSWRAARAELNESPIWRTNSPEPAVTH